MYQQATRILKRFFKQDQIFKYGFNLSPMYRRSTGRVIEASEDLHSVKVTIPISYKNKNYVGAIFGGSMFAATDPIYMIQLIQILGQDYVVWDKAATIRYKRPAREKLYALFQFAEHEIADIIQRVDGEKEIDVIKQLNLVNKEGQVFAELDKTIYVATKAFYKEKMASRRQKQR